MLMHTVLLSGIALTCLLLGSFFVTAKAACSRVTFTRAEQLLHEKRWGAKRLVLLHTRSENWKETVRFVASLCFFAHFLFVIVLVSRFLSFSLLEINMSHTFFLFILFVIGDVFFIFFFSSLLPRVWAESFSEPLALYSAPSISRLVYFIPLKLIMRSAFALSAFFAPQREKRSSSRVSEEEFLAYAEAAVGDSVLKEDERSLIASIIDFGDTIVREIMVPRPDIVHVSRTLSAEATLERMLKEGYSRVPVAGESLDQIVGVVYAKDIMSAVREHESQISLDDVMRPARFVPETKNISSLLREMQADRFHLALVIDEYGGLAGLVTLEDVLEELVGEIIDEFDAEEMLVETLPGGIFRVHARISIQEVNSLTGTNFPEGDWDSLGGFFLHQLGRVPQEGETFSYEGWWVRAEQVHRRRIGYVWLAPQE